MERTSEQKQLNVLSIIETIAGVVSIVFGIFAIGFGTMLGGASGQLVEEGIADAETAAQVAEAAPSFAGEGFSYIIIGLMSLLIAYLLKKAVNDATQYKPARTLVMISLAITAIALIVNIFLGDAQYIFNNIVQLGVDGYVFYLLNKVKETALAQ